MGKDRIEELSVNRRTWVKTTKENNFHDGIFNLLTELYPDNAHFLYELLQNAEDTGATEVKFSLNNNELIYSHNGRDFSIADIHGITSIGQGTKANDINKIGKFGVGFKAVFAYTSTPQIHSGDFNFQIEELVIPTSIEPISTDSPTVMCFPFNSNVKDRQQSYNEIKRGLSEFNATTILFLSSIKKVEFYVEGKSSSIRREEDGPYNVKIIQSLENREVSQWLRFKKPLGESNNLFTSIAFKTAKQGTQSADKIVPVNGKVSIFFPAEKETSNLKFHIHAPFASTVARDSIKDLPENEKLLEEIAELFTECLYYFKENGFIQSSLFEVLPIEDDNLERFYQPLLIKIKECFNQLALLPTDEGGFSPAVNCYRSSKRLKELVSIRDARLFYTAIQGIDEESDSNKSHERWLKNPQQRNSREDKFISSLSIRHLDEEDFLELLVDSLGTSWTFSNTIEKAKIFRWLASKDVEWTKVFYEFLYTLLQKKSRYYNPSSLSRIIRLSDGSINENGEQCFFAEDPNTTNKGLLFVEKELYDANATLEEQDSYKFLIQLGVKKVEDKDENRLLVKLLSQSKRLKPDKTLQRTNKLVNYYSKTLDISVFEDAEFIFNSKEDLVSPNELYLDEPFLKSGVGDHMNEDYDSLNTIYLNLDQLDLFLELIQKLGVHTTLPIYEQTVLYHPNFEDLHEAGKTSEWTIDEDYTIHDQQQLRSSNHYYSFQVWRKMCSLSEILLEKYRYAKFRRIKTSKLNTELSSLFIELKESSWLPGKDGSFYKPSEITLEDLDFSTEEFIDNGFIEAIDFGLSARKLIEEEKVQNDVFKSLGFSQEEVEAFEEFRKLGNPSKKEVREFNSWRQQRYIESNKVQKPQLKSRLESNSRSIEESGDVIMPDLVTDTASYADLDNLVLEQSLVNQEINIESKIVSRRKRPGGAETRQFLMSQYKGFCQICGFTFSKKDASNYFELYDWLANVGRKANENIIHPGSSLCLCSNCHSSVKHGDFEFSLITDLNTLELAELTFDEFSDLVQLKANKAELPNVYSFIEIDMYKLPIRLLNQTANIFYSEEHFIKFFNFLKIGD